MRVDIKVIGNAEYAHELGTSDHATMSLGIYEPGPSKRKNRLPMAWHSNIHFKRITNRLFNSIFCEDPELPASDPYEKLELHKRIFQTAAIGARDLLQYSSKEGSELTRIALDGVSRALWSADSQLANKLIHTSTLAASLIQFFSHI